MKSLKKYLNKLIEESLTEEQLKMIDTEDVLDKLEYRIEYEIENQEDWWKDKINEMI